MYNALYAHNKSYCHYIRSDELKKNTGALTQPIQKTGSRKSNIEQRFNN